MIRTIIFLCFGALLFSCNTRSATPSSGRSESESLELLAEQNKEVIMIIEPQHYQLGTEQVELTIRNPTDKTVEFGANYTIERFNTSRKEWEELPLEGVAFIMIMYMLPAGESQSYDISLYPENINYNAGQYRIKKQFFVDGESIEKAAPFTLK